MRQIIVVSVLALMARSVLGADVPTPEFYGIYLVVDGKIVTPRDAVPENRMGVCGTLLGGVDQGVRQVSGVRATSDAYFLLYGKEFETLLRGKLARLEYHDTITVGTGMIMDAKQQCRVQMWMRSTDIPVKIAPVRTVPDLYRVVPAAPLREGIYAFYYGSMDRAMMIEGAAAVFDFIVGDMPIPAVGAASVAAGGRSAPGGASAPGNTGKTAIGFLILGDDVPLYESAEGTVVKARLRGGTPAANAKGGFLGVPGRYELEEKNGRTRVVYLRERENRTPLMTMGWVDTTSLRRFPYAC